MHGLFITGTDTDVGKTYITASLVRALRGDGVRVGAYKPACSGVGTVTSDGPSWADIEALSTALDGEFDRERICPQRFNAPLAPPIAAIKEGRSVDSALLRNGAAWWDAQVDYLLVEGVGGLLCPLTETETVADLAVDLGFSLLIVAYAGLGTIGHTLLTIEAARSRSLDIAGIVLNHVDTETDDAVAASNAGEIERRGGVPVLACIGHEGSAGLLARGLRDRMDDSGSAKGCASPP
jgi:dethiobiotin synthetase